MLAGASNLGDPLKKIWDLQKQIHGMLIRMNTRVNNSDKEARGVKRKIDDIYKYLRLISDARYVQGGSHICMA
jgi:hypothetical protein